VTWSVPERRFIEGEKLAAKANGIGRARLVVSPNPLSRTLVRLLRPPEARPAHSLSGIFSLLSRANAARVLGATNLEETLDRLWGISNPLQVPPVLAPDAPASFLIVEPTESDAGELAGDSVVRSIWLGGYELGAPPR